MTCNTIRIAGIVKESIVDGPGIRYVVFAQGCSHGCQGCHNEAALDFSGGEDYEIEQIISDIGKNPLLAGVTFSGGEPFSQPEAFLNLAAELKQRNINIWAYTGYTYDELIKLSEENQAIQKLLGHIDVLVDGRFVLEKRDISLQFKGSSNQRTIDMNATREQGGVVILENL